MITKHQADNRGKKCVFGNLSLTDEDNIVTGKTNVSITSQKKNSGNLVYQRKISIENYKSLTEDSIKV